MRFASRRILLGVMARVRNGTATGAWAGGRILPGRIERAIGAAGFDLYPSPRHFPALSGSTSKRSSSETSS